MTIPEKRSAGIPTQPPHRRATTIGDAARAVQADPPFFRGVGSLISAHAIAVEYHLASVTVFPSRLLSYIPSPPSGILHIGPVKLHAYGLMIALAVLAAVWLAQKRWTERGGEPGTIAAVAIWAVPAGLIGARLYSVATSWQQDTGGHPWKIFAIWEGGLGIWGGIVAGVAVGVYVIRRKGLDWRMAMDCSAPAFALAQAIGRWGNYFNQELYGWHSKLPWALKIDHPNGSLTASTFQPTFLYECIWDLICVGILLWSEKRWRIRKGYLIALYAAVYCFGRFWVEHMRIDPAHKYLGLRLNDWTSIIVFVVAAAVFLRRGLIRGDESETSEEGEPTQDGAGDESKSDAEESKSESENAGEESKSETEERPLH